MLLLLGNVSTERLLIAWSSRLRNQRSTFSNRRCLYKWNADLRHSRKFCEYIYIYSIWWLKYNAAGTQPISMFSDQVPPPKVPDLRKSLLPSRAGTFWRAHFYPELYLDPGSSSGNTQSTGPKSLVPGESSCSGNGAKVTFTLFLFFILWWKMASILGLSELQGKKSELWEKKSEFRDINSQLLEKIWIWDKSPKYLVLFFYSVAIVNWQKKKKVFFF